MTALNGFVKLHRKMIEWGWYSDCVVKDVFLHILMVAAFKPGQYRGHEIQPVSYTHLRAHETGRNLVCRLLLEKKKKERNKETIPKIKKTKHKLT